MDNTANWSQSFGGSTKFAAEKVALATVVSALKTQFNLGLMMFTETGSRTRTRRRICALRDPAHDGFRPATRPPPATAC